MAAEGRLLSRSSSEAQLIHGAQFNRRHASGYLSMQPTCQTTIPRLDVGALQQRMTPVSMTGKRFVFATQHSLRIHFRLL